MKIAVVGGGPAGLMAAEAASNAGEEVEIYDAMASVGRKLLLAGKGGLNLTHSEPIEPFLCRYGTGRARLAPIIQSFGPEDIREWVQGLGIGTFVGTSGRVFPTDLKAAPLLRAWLRRLRKAGVRFHVRHRWLGWEERGVLRFCAPGGERAVDADAVILALGGGSWPKLGSDAAWVPILRQQGVRIIPLRPSNCGFDVRWSSHIKTKFAGHPLKSVAIQVTKPSGDVHRQRGECVLTETGLEGGLIYAVSSYLRDEIEKRGQAMLTVDLAPDRDLSRLTRDLSKARGKRTMATHLQRQAGVAGVKSALLREVFPKDTFDDPIRLAKAIKAVPLNLVAARPLEEAISTAGGVLFEELDDRLMVRRLPGVFCAGEMLDWEAPTGGYLLTACLATGRTAGVGAVTWIRERQVGRALLTKTTP
jgi:uncharacterized flavoprotein (TIGR03862 family)